MRSDSRPRWLATVDRIAAPAPLLLAACGLLRWEGVLLLCSAPVIALWALRYVPVPVVAFCLAPPLVGWLSDSIFQTEKGLLIGFAIALVSALPVAFLAWLGTSNGVLPWPSTLDLVLRGDRVRA